ncbi:MAG: glycerol kinase [Rhodospirillales bacterium]|nr:glycerol kinase [Rhodospirillales bacterium]
MAERHLLAVDQGTTSTRAILFNGEGAPLASAQSELPQIYPRPGWVEHDPEEIWRATVSVMKRTLANAKLAPADIAAIGITNQRETTVLWDRASGKPIHNAIVWQDRRTAEWCRRMAKKVGDKELGKRTGLLFDAYFSASKIAWLLDNVAGARAAAEKGRLAFGTIDSFLLWRLTGGKSHLTDATNAARTMLFNLRTQAFRGIAGDQHAATVGQACFAPGMIKSTYGTGCFVVLNTGSKMVRSKNRLLTTLAYRLDGKPVFAVEGSIFISGAAVQWLRDGLKIIASAAETQGLAASVPDTGGVYLVPAFTGLGAPWWDPDARGAILGLTRDSGRAHVARAALEATVYQTRDLMTAMAADGAAKPAAIRVDGGMAASDWTMQFLADQLATPVERPAVTETTALGAAYLAGLASGVFSSTADIARRWRRERRFEPAMGKAVRERLYAGWQDAVRRVRN